MSNHTRYHVKKNRWFVLALLFAGVMTACKKELPTEFPEAAAAGGGALSSSRETGDPVSDPEIAQPADQTAAQPEDADAKQEQPAGDPAGPPAQGAAQAQKEDILKKRFGESCIAEQTFEAELSEYSSGLFCPVCAFRGQSGIYGAPDAGGAGSGRDTPLRPGRPFRPGNPEP